MSTLGDKRRERLRDVLRQHLQGGGKMEIPGIVVEIETGPSGRRMVVDTILPDGNACVINCNNVPEGMYSLGEEVTLEFNSMGDLCE